MSALNRDYMTVGGTFTGTVDTDYEIYINNLDTVVYKIRQNGEWTSTTSPAGHVTTANWDLDSPITLTGGFGVTITFTRGLKSLYVTGDKWSFTKYASIQLSEYNADGYDTLEILERKTKRDLVVMSSTTGRVSLVKDFEGTPTVEKLENINAGTVSDTCIKNKEIFIATKSESPKFLGYTKNDSFDGVTDDFRFIEDNAYEQIDSESFQSKALDDFVFLRGNGANQGAGNIIAGIIYGDNSLYIWNKDTSNVYKFTLGSNPIRVRPNSSIHVDGTIINGIAVLTGSQSPTESFINTIECWRIPFSGSLIGQSANLDKVIHLKKPTQNSNITSFSDFLIVSSHFNLAHASAQFDIILAPALSGKDDIQNMCLFKYENFDDATVSITSYVNITPSLNYSATTPVNNSFVARKKTQNFEWTGYESEGDPVSGTGIDGEKSLVGDATYTTTSSVDAHIDFIQDISLAFSGYDTDGVNPMIHFTARLAKNTENALTGHTQRWLGDYSQNGNATGLTINFHKGPYWQDNTGKILAVSWVTFSLSALSTGPTKCAKLLHLADWNNPAMFREAYLEGSEIDMTDLSSYIDNYDYPPNKRPNYSISGGKGRKALFIGDTSDSGLRWGFTVIRPYAVNGVTSNVYTFKTPNVVNGPHFWEGDGVWIYPNIWSGLYSAITAGELSSEVQPGYVTSALEVADTTDSKRWSLGDTDYGMAMTTHYPTITTYKHTLMSAPSNNGDASRISQISMSHESNATNATNLLGGNTGWITLATPVPNASMQWEGSQAKKSFYKISLVYDGYQESTLLSITSSYSQADFFTEALQMLITIKSTWVAPDRVGSIVIYRADDPLQNAISPSGFYRFIEEIPLVAFSTNSISGDYQYTVTDKGPSKGSYSSINGIDETLTRLYLEYSVCASLNGYMFVGDCAHSKFDSAENFIFRSQPGKFSVFDWSKDFTPVDFVPKAIVGYMGKLYVFGNDKVSIINPETLIIEDEINGIGCVGPKAIQITPNGLYWFDQNNIYLSTPQVKKIGTTILKQADYGWNTLSIAEKASAVSGYDSNRHVYLIYIKKGSDNRVWSYYSSTNRWDLWATDYRVLDTVQSSDGHAILLMDNGRIAKHLGGTNKRDWEFQTKKLSFGASSLKKKLKNIKIDSTDSTAVAVSYKTNNNNSAWQSGTDSRSRYFASQATGGTSIKIAPSDSKLRWVKLKVTGDNNQAGSDRLVDSIGFVYKPKRAK